MNRTRLRAISFGTLLLSASGFCASAFASCSSYISAANEATVTCTAATDALTITQGVVGAGIYWLHLGPSSWGPASFWDNGGAPVSAGGTIRIGSLSGGSVTIGDTTYTPADGLNGTVNSIALAGANVYAGGDFTDAGGNPNGDYIARWDGVAWQPLGTGTDGPVLALTSYASELIAGGEFTDDIAVGAQVGLWPGVEDADSDGRGGGHDQGPVRKGMRADGSYGEDLGGRKHHRAAGGQGIGG